MNLKKLNEFGFLKNGYCCLILVRSKRGYVSEETKLKNGGLVF